MTPSQVEAFIAWTGAAAFASIIAASFYLSYLLSGGF